MFSKNDLYFALLLAFFLEWGEVLMMPGLTWPNVGHVALRYALLALMLEAVFFLVAYLRKKTLFGHAKSAYYSWGRVVPVSVIVSACYALVRLLTLPSPVTAFQWWALAVLFVAGCLALMLYFYGLVQKPDDKR